MPEVEGKATKVEDILGKWVTRSSGGMVIMRFLPNGRWDVHYGKSIGEFSFVDGKLLIDMPKTDVFCPNGDAYYDVWAIRQAGKVTKLRFASVGRDPCPERSLALDGQTIVRYER